MSPPISWSLEPAPVLLALILLAVYVPRWVRVRRSRDRRHASAWRLMSWVMGVLTLAVAQGNPIDGLGDYLLFMHMIQHLLLLDVMPLFLLFGLNRVLMRPVTRRVQWIEQRLGFLAQPWFAVVAYTGGMWLWHIPILYDTAARHDTVHLLEHMTFTGVGFLYWWHLLRPIPARHRMHDLGPVFYMGITKVTVGLLGAAMTFAPDAIYSFYETGNRVWGLSPTADQSLGGVIMATEQLLIMGLAFGAIFVRTMEETEQRAVREERLLDRREREAAGIDTLEPEPGPIVAAGGEQEPSPLVGEAPADLPGPALRRV